MVRNSRDRRADILPGRMKARLFVTFEGIEGCGKSTHVKRLESRLKDAGYGVLSLREPGGTPLCEEIRDILKTPRPDETVDSGTEALLFIASRRQIAREVILPALDKGVCVLCDRFADSTTAYQAYGRGLDLKMIRTMNDFAIGEAVPDLTVLLDIPVDESMKRVEARCREMGIERDRIEMEKVSFHEKVRQGYLTMARNEENRFMILDSTMDGDTVHNSIWRGVEALLARKGNAKQ